MMKHALLLLLILLSCASCSKAPGAPDIRELVAESHRLEFGFPGSTVTITDRDEIQELARLVEGDSHGVLIGRSQHFWGSFLVTSYDEHGVNLGSFGISRGDYEIETNDGVYDITTKDYRFWDYLARMYIKEYPEVAERAGIWAPPEE